MSELPQCADCINNTKPGCADNSMCIHAAHAEIARLRKLVKSAYVEAEISNRNKPNVPPSVCWVNSDAFAALEAK